MLDLKSILKQWELAAINGDYETPASHIEPMKLEIERLQSEVERLESELNRSRTKFYEVCAIANRETEQLKNVIQTIIDDVGERGVWQDVAVVGISNEQYETMRKLIGQG